MGEWPEPEPTRAEDLLPTSLRHLPEPEPNDMTRIGRRLRRVPLLRALAKLQAEADALDDPEAVERFVRSCVVTRRPEGDVRTMSALTKDGPEVDEWRR